MADSGDRKVAIIGSGLIGRSYAMLFASSGYQVSLYDIEIEQIDKAKDDIKSQLLKLEEEDEQYQLIQGVTDLKSCVEDAFFVLECVPERLEIKQNVWKEAEPFITRDDVILSSSTSALLPSDISRNFLRKERFIISHPTNPPFYVPLVEVVPASWTDADVVTQTLKLLESIGLVPVLVRKEVKGFVLNRIQYAILAESWRLIRDGVMTAGDLDKVMSCGLGVRYAFMGPFETAYLNAEGMHSYSERYADMILGIQQDMGPPERMDGPVLDLIQIDMEATVGPVSEIQQRRQWRDRRLAALAKLKADLNKND
ncbi:hypothetical protein C0Q70_11032 [Pomacea canaliculata]|uniref:3-hydroxyacyl-CoA dehydrogenase NAD binding domain-containing protein n=1 Tax=Pomacea canaliculata TaxID=400727 RepID=A0A2T7P4U5_POMCA|nr:hypothetical protein C0Q70_11032 [Pomacea canaliculata]